VWISHKPAPAKGGEAGEMLAKIIEKAAALKAQTQQPKKKSPTRKTVTKPTARKTTAKRRAK